MGWTTYYRKPGQTDAEHLSAELLCEGDEMLASATVGLTFYAAVKRGEEVFAIVVLQQRTPKSAHNYGYKPMTESMLPGEARAPAKVLNALTPTEDAYSLDWRALCRENIEKKAAGSRVKPGDLIHFFVPMTFGNGETADTMRFVERSTFRLQSGTRVRVPSWKTSRGAWEILP